MENPVWCIVTMVKGKEAAEGMAEAAIVEGKAACSQIEGPVTSIYSWEETIHREEEMRIVFKATEAKVKDLMAWIRLQHPYKVPEILAWQADLSDPDYRDWVNMT